MKELPAFEYGQPPMGIMLSFNKTGAVSAAQRALLISRSNVQSRRWG